MGRWAGPQEWVSDPWDGKWVYSVPRYLHRKGGQVTPCHRSLVPLVCMEGGGSGIQLCVPRPYRQTYVGQLSVWMHCWCSVRD